MSISSNPSKIGNGPTPKVLATGDFLYSTVPVLMCLFTGIDKYIDAEKEMIDLAYKFV